jgi:hypothetical protein
MPGDEIVPKASFNETRAITIDAPPDEVWPWIVQIGYRRAGFYTYALLDNAGYESADRILGEYQHPKIGDWMPMATSHVPQPLRGRMSVDWTWAYELRVVDTTTTRLMLRVRATFAPWWVRLIYDGLIVPSDFVIARSMLRGIARRAEGRPSRGDFKDAARRRDVSQVDAVS